MNFLSKNKSIILIIILFIGALVVLFANNPKEFSVNIDDALNTSSRIIIYGNNSKQIAKHCEEMVRTYDNMFSATDTTGELYAFNHSDDEYAFSAETFDLISDCEQFYYETNGAFDITLGVLSQLWNNAILTATLPDENSIKDACALTDFSSLKFNEDNHSVSKTIKGQQINLGAVAKGYIAENISQYLKSSEADGALVDLGGNIYVFGKRNNKDKWKIGIQNPFDLSNVIGTVDIDEGFVITSGDYQRYMISDNIRYHHIIDAKTGYPAKTNLRSVTIISDNGFIGDALSTSCFLVGLEQSIELINKYNVSGIIVTDDKRIFYSEGLSNVFNHIENEFTYETF